MPNGFGPRSPPVSADPISPRSVEDGDGEDRRGRSLKRRADDFLHTGRQPTKKVKSQKHYCQRDQHCRQDQDTDEHKNTKVIMASQSASQQDSMERLSGAILPVSDRLILRPTPPSSRLRGSHSPGSSHSPSRSRSRSPARHQLTLLEAGQPPVRILSTTDHEQQYQAPAQVSALRRLLVRDATVGVIPSDLEERFQTYSPAVYDDTPSTAFSQTCDYGPVHGDMLWSRVKEIEQGARKCMYHHQDESAWALVVFMVLGLAIDTARPIAAGALTTQLRGTHVVANNESDDNHLLIDIIDIRTQTIEPTFLPCIPSRGPLERMVPLPKKTDIVMAVAPESKALVDVKMRCSAPHAWSHMADCYTSTIPLFCGLEVKRHGGSSEEAELQLGVWQAAALAHLTARLAIEAYPAVSPSSLVPPVIPPTIGCTVVGHQWSFYIAWTEPANGNQGAVTTLGPLSPNTGTLTITTIFTLVSLLRKLIIWFKTEYWPLYQELVTQPIVAQTT